MRQKEEKEFHQDSSWSWVVAMAAFVAHLITHGIVYSFGILFLTLEDNFNGTKAELSWIPSLTTGTLYLIGPVASIMINRYGCRAVSVVGSILGFLGYLASIFVRHLYMLYITMGIVAGCGFGMVFLPAILIVTKYFNKYRSLACGLALSGAGGGAFILSPLIDYLIDTYAWKGTLLLLSAIILNCIPCALIFRSLPTTKTISRMESLIDDQTDQLREEKYSLVQSDKERNYNDMHLDYAECQTVNDKLDEKTDTNKHLSGRGSRSEEDSPSDPVIIEIVHEDAIKGKVIEIVNSSNNYDKTRKLPESAFTRYITLFKCSEVSAFYVSQFLFFAGFYLPFIYIPDKARGHDIQEEDAAWVASTIGISSITGRIVLGYLADRPFVNRMIMFKAALLMTGISTSLLPLFNTLWLLLIYAVVYGVSTGITLSLTSVVLADIAGIDLLADAMGLNNLFSAFGSLLGPPLAGFLYDITKNYTASFLASGITMTVSGLLLIVTSFCRKKNIDQY
ncbi:monocarboxylate transporter 13-like [Mercenaria mercenaria]|uniref:monocarboxylate transporter 13-like n=1 Tax=Mercenaria mercenaria TaxID=6596 RepID=UPI00234E5E05|nr:monocarboxylate transporter 13-like [Mercenaria mercenaria]XP_045201697.2 monocarboxylate transporter 13-like [Mercenaria mercenaria]